MGATTVPTIITVLGAILATAGIACWFGLSITFENKVHEALTVTSVDDSEYAAFEDSKHEDARPPKASYTFFHVENADAVRSGASAPVFREVGPYVYTKHYKKLNVTFLDEGRQVRFLERTYYEPVVEETGTAADGTTKLDGSKDTVTCFYPFYFAAIGSLASLVPAGTNVTETVLELAVRTASVGQMYQLYDATYSSAITDQTARAGNTVSRLLDVSTASAGPPPRVPIPAVATTAKSSDLVIWMDFLVGTTTGMVNPNVGVAVTNTGKFYAVYQNLATNCPNPSAAAQQACVAYTQAAQQLYPSLAGQNAQVILARMGEFHSWSGALLSGAWASFNLANTGTGVLVTHKVEEWLYGFTDPLLATMLGLLGLPASAARVGFFSNATDAVAMSRDEFYTLETGKHNKSAIGQHVEFNSQRTIDVYSPPIAVRGTDGVVNGMELSQTEPLTAFVTQVSRPADLVPDKENTHDIRGITTFRYTLDPAELEPSAARAMSVKGLFNIAQLSNGIPLVLSKSRFLDSALAGAYNITATAEKDDTIVYVEPFTGRSMKANLRLQINLAIPGAILDGSFHGSMGRGAWLSAQPATVVPIVTVDEYGEVSEEDADDFKKAVYGTRTIIIAITAALCAIGGIIMIVGGFMCARAMKKEESEVTPMTRMDEP